MTVWEGGTEKLYKRCSSLRRVAKCRIKHKPWPQWAVLVNAQLDPYRMITWKNCRRKIKGWRTNWNKLMAKSWSYWSLKLREANRSELSLFSQNKCQKWWMPQFLTSTKWKTICLLKMTNYSERYKRHSARDDYETWIHFDLHRVHRSQLIKIKICSKKFSFIKLR